MEINLIKENTTVIEYVTFKAKSNISNQQMLLACKETDTVLHTIEGFLHRFIALQEDNTWVEVVFWKSITHAKNGLKLFLNHKISKIFLEKIEEGTVRIEYATIA